MSMLNRMLDKYVITDISVCTCHVASMGNIMDVNLLDSVVGTIVYQQVYLLTGEISVLLSP